MIIDMTSWHARLYLWTRQQMHLLRALEAHNRTEGTLWYIRQAASYTNLCQYLRTLFIWLPLLLAIWTAVAAWVLWCVVWYPLSHVGVGHYLGAWLFIASGVGAIVGLVFLQERFGVITLPFMLFGQGIVAVYEKCHEPRANGGPGLCVLIGHWVADKHERICRIIEIRG